MAEIEDDPFGAPVVAEEGGDGASDDGEVEVVGGDSDGDAPPADEENADPFGANVADEGGEPPADGADPFASDGAGQPLDAAEHGGHGDELPEGFDPYASDDDEPAAGSLAALMKRQAIPAADEGTPHRGDSDAEGNAADDEEEAVEGGGFGWNDGLQDAQPEQDGGEEDEEEANISGFRAFQDGDGAGAFGDIGGFVEEESDSDGGASSVHSIRQVDGGADYGEGDGQVVEVQSQDEDEEAPKKYPEWDAAPMKMKLFSILEPSVTEHMEQPPLPWAVSVAYHFFYLAVLLANGFANVAGTYRTLPFSRSSLDAIKTIAAAMFVFDLVTRAPLVFMIGKRYVPALLLDAVTSASEIILLTSGDMGYNEINYFPPLRSTRVFLFTGLFIRTETFRDIHLAIRTVGSSLRPLLVFIVLVVIGLLMFSTFVYLAERGEWNSAEQRWYRECHPFLSVCTGYELSPFQSIPDSMWLIIQSMTTVGYGDVTPTSTLGRFVAGCAIICGVFVVAFPAMVLIGNLDQSRRDFFAQQERDEVEKEYREREAELANAAEAEKERTMAETRDAIKKQRLDATNDDSDAEHDNEKLEFIPSSRAMLFGDAASGGAVVSAKSTMPPVEDLAATRADFGHCGTAFFSFMGDDAREVERHPRGYWQYAPIFQLLPDPSDGLPLFSNVHADPSGTAGVFFATVTLILDDPEAQALASEAAEKVDPDCTEPMAHAAPVFALDVTFKRPVAGVLLRRRVNTGMALDHTVPLTLELIQAESGTREEFIESARRGVNKAQLVVKYNRQPVTSLTWTKNVPITSVMLSTTPFIQDLRAIAINIAPREYWPEASRKAANAYARERRNVAYITHRHLVLLVYPIFRKVVTSSFVLRNITEFTDTVANMIKLHCRELRRHDVPAELAACVYLGDTLGAFEKVYEVDVDYFRTIDWPLGTVPCEYSERQLKSEVVVRVADACKGEQPVIADIEAFRRADDGDGRTDEPDVDVFSAEF